MQPPCNEIYPGLVQGNGSDATSSPVFLLLHLLTNLLVARQSHGGPSLEHSQQREHDVCQHSSGWQRWRRIFSCFSPRPTSQKAS